MTHGDAKSLMTPVCARAHEGEREKASPSVICHRVVGETAVRLLTFRPVDVPFSRGNGDRVVASFDLETGGLRIVRWSLVRRSNGGFLVEPPTFRGGKSGRAGATGGRIEVRNTDLARAIKGAAIEAFRALPGAGT